MKLYWSPTSPFARKILVMVKEKGIAHMLQMQESNPLDRAHRATLPNPLRKIPCLVTDDGFTLYDSPVIVEFLDTHCDGPDMLPPDGAERWRVLRCQATADGMIDALVACFVEKLRKPERRSTGFLAHNRDVALRCVQALAADVERLDRNVDIGSISAGVALAYLETSFSDTEWREENPDLAGWFSGFEQRASMTETVLRVP